MDLDLWTSQVKEQKIPHSQPQQVSKFEYQSVQEDDISQKVDKEEIRPTPVSDPISYYRNCKNDLNFKHIFNSSRISREEHIQQRRENPQVNAFKQYDFCKSYPYHRELFMPTKVAAPSMLEQQDIVSDIEGDAKMENLERPNL